MSNFVSVSVSDGFEEWLNQQPRWLQTAAAFLLTQDSAPSEQDIETLSNLCISEASNQPASFATVPTGRLTPKDKSLRLRLRTLANPQGINALSPESALPFDGLDLVVIYGPNGSGKSGYARLLKHVVGTRGRSPLLPNVFSTHSITTQQAEVEFNVGQTTQRQTWSTATGPLPDLASVQVFDTETATRYLTQTQEASYEPQRLRLLSALIDICDRVRERIGKMIASHVSRLPALPGHLDATAPIVWVKNLTHKTGQEEIERYCQFDDVARTQLDSIKEVLAQPDPENELRATLQRRQRLKRTMSLVESFNEALSDENLAKLREADLLARSAREAATVAADRIFSDASLEGIGSSTWRALWQAAERYSTSEAYPEKDFPNIGEGALCVLCQQPLSGTASDRLKAFRTFVAGELHANAEKLEAQAAALRAALPDPPDLTSWIALLADADVSEAEAVEHHRRLATSLAHAKACAVEQATAKTAVVDLLSKLARAFEDYARRSSDLQLAVEEQGREALARRAADLEAREWLFRNRLAIEAEVARLKAVSVLELAQRRASTQGLTKKKNELADIEIANGYRERFIRELGALGGSRLKVQPSPKKAGKGKVTFTLRLENAEGLAAAHTVLSEGECRVVALATFLADVSDGAGRSPFVFDDPISSLDQDFEERVVERLVEMSNDRQVIVFTHRLSLVTLIEDSIRRRRINHLPAPATNRTVHLTRIGDRVGMVTDATISTSRPEKALNKLKTRLASARKLHTAGNIEEYFILAKSICSDFRIIVERTIEIELLNEVILRFRRSVQTMGRLASLSKISAADCQLLDDMMTRYSVFEHSQPDELPSQLPDPDQLGADIDRLLGWISSYGKRPVG